MNKEELELYVKKSCDNILKQLAENPKEMFDLLELQDKYNNLLKEKIELKRQIKKQKEIIDRLNFIKNRKNQGASQENINKMAIKFVNSYLNEVSE